VVISKLWNRAVGLCIDAIVSLADPAGIPLTILVAFAWIQRQAVGQAVWVAGSLISAWLTDPYYGSLCLAISAVTGLIGIAWGAAYTLSPDALRRLAVLASCIGGLAGGRSAIILKPTGPAVQVIFVRTVVEVGLYGPHPTGYVRSSRASRLLRWPLGGDWPGRAGGDAKVFLGWSTLTVAGVWTVST
jgi:hypothetical protein